MRAVYSHTESFLVVSHIEIVTGSFIKQKTKGALDKLNIYLSAF